MLMNETNPKGNHQILIVEDEKIIAKDLELRLIQMNYDVVACVSTGREALSLIKNQPIDLILMDIMIDGDIDGIETAELIHQERDVPIIYLTAYADEKTFQRAKLSDPFGYLIKPFQERDLDLTIRTVLQKFSFERQIKASETRYRSLFEQSQDAIIIFDGEGKILDANKAAGEIYALKIEKLEQYHIHQLVQPKERTKLDENLKQFLEKGEIKGRYKFIDRYLNIKYIEYQAKANYLPGNHLAVIRDITQSVEDQRKIENLAKFPSEAPHPILRISTSGEIMYANKAAHIFLDEWQPKYENSIPNNLKDRLSALNPTDNQLSLSLNIKNRYFLLLFVYVAKGDYINIYGTDITQQKQSERIINHQKDIMELIAKGEGLSNVLERVCAKIQQFMPNGLPAIHLYDEVSRQLNFAAGPRLPLDFVASFQKIQFGKNHTTIGAAAYVKDLVVIQNIEEEPSWKEKITEARVAGFVSCWALPVLGQSDELLAVISLYYREEHKPATSEITLVNMACKLAGIAIERDRNYQSLTKHSLVFENISDAVILTDIEGKITEWSPSAERLFRYKKGEILGKKIRDSGLFSDSNLLEEQVGLALGDSLDDDAKFSSEIQFLKKEEGEPGIAELNVVKLKDLTGAIVGSLRVIRDITQKKRVENALRISENYLKAIFDNTIQSFILLDLEFKVLTFNKKAADFILENTGQKLSSGEFLTDFWYQNEVKKFLSVSARSLGGEYVKYEEFVENENGESIWLEINFLPVYDHENKLTSICFTALDISERKQAELELAESEARFRSLVQNSSDIITVLDSEGRVTYTSESTERMLGYLSNNLIGSALHDLVLPENQVEFEQTLNETKADSNDNHTIEYQIKDAEGRIVYLESVMNNLLTNKSIQGIVVNSRDITQRKETEIELKKTNFELDSFVYRASHDLRAPLRSVLGLLNLIKMESNDEQKAVYAALAEKSINKLDSFILDLTNFSRNTRLEIQKERIDFEGIIAECIANLKYMENADRVKSILEFNTSEPYFSDPGRMSILFQNLLSNAIKYQRSYVESFVKVKIETNSFGVYIEVEDNGKGISREYLDKIFEMFFRASEDSYGSGLGLYITKQVVEKLQGKITVESVFNEGTTFKVWLPHLIQKEEAELLEGERVKK
jgi:PAS domain S-box-containing protein